MKWIKNIFLALCSALAITTSFDIFYGHKIKNIPFWLLVTVYIISLIIFSFLYCKKSEKEDKYSKTLAGLLSFFSIIGSGFSLYGSFLLLLKSKTILLTIIKWLGYYKLYKYIIYSIERYFPKKIKLKEKLGKIGIAFNKHPFLYSFLTIALCWSIYYVAFYPIVLSPDPSYQIKQFLGEKTKYLDYSVNIDDNVTITNHHPVLHTVFLGSCLKLGRYILNDNFGLFIYLFIQGIVLALTLSATISFLYKRKIKTRYLLIMLGIYSLVPIFPLYALNANKDVYYSIFFINIIMLIFNFIDKYKDKKYPIKNLIYLGVLFLLLSLFRNNGIYLVIGLAPFIIFYSKINIKRMLIPFLSSIIVFFSFQNILLPYLKITKGSPREVLSIVFQQTARYVNNHEDDLSEEDKQIIGKILDYDSFSKYNPDLADPIKNTYNKYATKEDLINYFKVWGKGLIQHPLTYVDATLNNTYGYFDPSKVSWYVYYDFSSLINQNNLTTYHYNDLDSLRNALGSYGSSFMYIPILGLICNIGFSTWIILAFSLYLLLNKDKRYYLLSLIPSFVSLLVCVVSPANAYFRYAMPNVFSDLLLIGLWLYIYKKRT